MHEKITRNYPPSNDLQVPLGSFKRVRCSDATQAVENNSYSVDQLQSHKQQAYTAFVTHSTKTPSSIKCVRLFLFSQINFPLRLTHYVMYWTPFDAIVEYSRENKVTKEPTSIIIILR